MTGRDKPDSARRTEGEGVPSPSAVAPSSGVQPEKRNRDDRPREKARPQQRERRKTDKR